MKMTKEEFNLSGKKVSRIDGFFFYEQDVQEFIKRLKEADIIGRKMLLEVIDKLAGDELI